jgi:FtsP/CotA-like multicopper oxidase with cupredoxin domain
MRNDKSRGLKGRFLGLAGFALALSFVLTAHAAAPGITGPTFNLIATPDFISQPDGAYIYSWGYGCDNGYTPTGFVPAGVAGGNCPQGFMQIPGPTLVVNQGDTVTVTLHNNLPAAAGNTSILFPGFDVTTTSTDPGVPGILTREATHGGTVTYTFVATNAGTHSYYSGTRGDVQIEMGLYGALIVLPKSSGGSVLTTTLPDGYTTPTGQADTCYALGDSIADQRGDGDYRLADAAYDHPAACYDREYMVQFSEMDPAIHRQVEEQKDLTCTEPTGCMQVVTEPYHPAYFMMNGRSFPDNVDPNYSSQYPRQPYNFNPHIHPGELLLLREIGQGRWQHPLHEHGNHLRVLGYDGHMLLTASGDNKIAGPLEFTTDANPGQTTDAVFTWTGKNLNWDIYGHGAQVGTGADPTADSITGAPCHPDAAGYYTTASGAPVTARNYFEWCGDHGKPLEDHPFGNVGSGGPVTLPDPNILTNGPWYSGSPYLGPEATTRAVGSTPIPPSGTVANSPTEEAGFAFIWHSHNERELTTNNIFPGGMMTMLLVDPWSYDINETN